MRYARSIALLALLLSLPTIATAQPDEGQFAVGGDLGWYFPAADQLETGFLWGGLVEGYLTPRIGLRGGVFYTAPEFERGDDDAARQIRVGADLIYNWEGGVIHPFVGAGVGAHFMQFTDDGEDVGDGDAKLGFNVLGGLEYFLNRAWTVKGELRYHWIDDFGGLDPDGAALTIGLKRYF